MSNMTDERAAEVLDWFSKFGPLGTAEIGHAIDHAVSRLRSQPPAEAQPVAWRVEHDDGGSHIMDAATVDNRFREALKQAGRRVTPLYAHPPPSAPVGVAEAWQEGYRQGVLDERTSEANIGIAGFGAKVEPARNNPYALAQQPTPVAPVGMEAKDAEIEALRAERDTVVNEAAKYAERSGRAQAEVDHLRRGNKRLAEALRELEPFAQHHDSCGDHDAYNNSPIRTCGCGLDSLLERIAALRDHDQEGK